MRWFLALPLVLAVACDDDPMQPQTGHDAGADAGGGPNDMGGPPDMGGNNGFPDATADEDTGVVADAGADGGIPRDPNCPQTAYWVTNVRGRILDGNGQPSVGSKAQLCVRTVPAGSLLCLRPQDSQANGDFSIDVPGQGSARCMSEGTMRFVRPLEDTAASYCHLDLSSGADVINVTDPFRIYSTVRATTIPPEGEPTMSRTIVFPGGLEMDVVPANYFPGSGAYADLAAAPLSLAANDQCALAGQAPFDGVYAFSPEGDFSDRAQLRMPNTAGLPANSTVRIFVLGGLGCTLDTPEMIPEGSWTEIENGTVSADGNTITVTPGIPCLSWVAYRAN